jgi:hypothetical protein
MSCTGLGTGLNYGGPARPGPARIKIFSARAGPESPVGKFLDQNNYNPHP